MACISILQCGLLCVMKWDKRSKLKQKTPSHQAATAGGSASSGSSRLAQPAAIPLRLLRLLRTGVWLSAAASRWHAPAQA